MLKFGYERAEAKRATVLMEGDITTYALNFLNIFNHTREYPSIFLKLENNPSNKVFVTFNPDEEESVIEYLENFGTIERISTVRLYDVCVDYDMKDFDKVYDRDDVDFLIDMD